MHLKGRGPAALKLNLPAGTYKLTWFAPETGAKVGEQSVRHAGGLLAVRTPGFEEDLAAKIEKE